LHILQTAFNRWLMAFHSFIRPCGKNKFTAISRQLRYKTNLLNDNSTRYSPKVQNWAHKGSTFRLLFLIWVYVLGRVLATPPHLMMIKLLMVADDNFYLQISFYRRVLEPRLGKQIKQQITNQKLIQYMSRIAKF